MHERPNDSRGFFHKKIFGAISSISKFIPGVGGTISGITGAIAGIGGSSTPGRFPLAAGGGCPPGTPGCGPQLAQRPGTSIIQRAQQFVPGGATGMVDIPFGDAVVGQFGAGLEPAVFASTTRRCPRGAVLGSDGLCYNRRDIANGNRAWPRGRRPLLTGGEMRAITVASRAAKKLETKQKQLRKLGMMRPLRPARRLKALPSGHHAHAHHD